MEAAASVIAVIDISAKVIALCSNYASAVADAQDDVARLDRQVKGLKTTLERARSLVAQPNNSLPVSSELAKQLGECRNELADLQARLEPGHTRQAMRRFGLRALKWPLKRDRVSAIISNLDQYQRAIMDGLQVDQTTLLLSIDERIEGLTIQPSEDVSIGRKPHFVVPFPRDPDFVERPIIRAWIQEQYAGPASRMALVGLGGFGKSQLAIDFAHEVHSKSSDMSVFWVHGGTRATFEESYRSLADTLVIPRRHDPNADTLALVRDWLQRQDVAPWLMVLDNADDLDTFFNPNDQKPIASYLPKTGNGKLLVTSRNLNVAQKLTGSHKFILQISNMDNSEALDLFRHKLKSGFDESTAEELIRVLGFVPLAVSQAAAYLNRRAPRVTIASYLESFQENEQNKTSLLNFDGGDIRRHEGVSNSVVITWQVTFEQLRRERPSAAKLLSLLSFFQPQNIPDCMLAGYSRVVMDAKNVYQNDENLDDDLDFLRAYSLIRISKTSCDMHSLIQFCTQRWLSRFDNLMQWRSLYLRLCAKHFLVGEFETWAFCQTLLPHIQVVLEQHPVNERDILEWSELLTNVACYVGNKGNYTRAEPLAAKAVALRERLLGAEDASTLRSMHKQAVVLRELGRWDEAESLQVRVVETRQRLFGEEDPDTLRSMQELASILYHQGRWKEAESLDLKSLEISQYVSGEEHPDTLRSIINLASTFSQQGRWREAESLQRKVLETRQHVLGEEHPGTLNAIANLALSTSKQGRWKEAESLQRKVLKIRQRVIGEEHPDTLTIMSGLACTIGEQGRWKEAELLEMKLLEQQHRILGEEHPDTLRSMGNLALIIGEQGRWKEAELLEMKLLEQHQRILGEEHPETLLAMFNLGHTSRALGRFEEALRLMHAHLFLGQRVLGLQHPDTRDCGEALEEWELEDG